MYYFNDNAGQQELPMSNSHHEIPFLPSAEEKFQPEGRPKCSRHHNANDGTGSLENRTNSLMLEQAQAALDNHVLQDGSWGDVDGAALGGNDDNGALERHATAKVDGTGDG